MRRVIVAFFGSVLAILLSSCVSPAPTEMPPWVVILTRGYPEASGRCTGSMFSADRGITAYHCVSGRNPANRLATQFHETANIEVLVTYPDLDIAVFQTARPLYFPSYAEYEDYDPKKQPATHFGVCPLYFSHVPRTAIRMSGEWINHDYVADCEHWAIVQTACGGDSGGPVVQDGKVVGVSVALKNWYLLPFFVEGNQICVVPSYKIKSALEAFPDAGSYPPQQ